MDDPPLKDQPTVESIDEDEHIAEHLRDSDEQGMQNFLAEPLRTDNPTEKEKLPPDEMIDHTFLMPPRPDGSRIQAKIMERVQIMRDKVAHHPKVIKFKCIVDNDYEEIVAYNDIVDFIEQDQTWDGIWKFEKILNHQGPIKSSDPKYKGLLDYQLPHYWNLAWSPRIAH